MPENQLVLVSCRSVSWRRSGNQVVPRGYLETAFPAHQSYEASAHVGFSSSGRAYGARVATWSADLAAPWSCRKSRLHLGVTPKYGSCTLGLMRHQRIGSTVRMQSAGRSAVLTCRDSETVLEEASLADAGSVAVRHLPLAAGTSRLHGQYFRPTPAAKSSDGIGLL